MAAEQIIGEAVSGHENGGRFFSKTAPSSLFCAACDSLLDSTYRPTNIDVRTSLDFSTTEDGATVCSHAFVAFCREHEIRGIDFDAVHGKDRIYYVPKASRVLDFDAKRRETKFIKKCPKCGNYSEVIGATPVFLRNGQLPPIGFSLTDLSFGSGRRKRPLFLIDCETASLLRRSRLRGMSFKSVLA